MKNENLIAKVMYKHLLVLATLVLSLVVLESCTNKPIIDGAYDFIVYESDSDNSDLSDNTIVVKYHIEYYQCKTVTDTLIKKGDAYYFSDDSDDYLNLTDSGYGLSYTSGYFANYSECSGGKSIDVSWSYTAINGIAATSGIGETPLEGLTEYGFVINGWK